MNLFKTFFSKNKSNYDFVNEDYQEEDYIDDINDDYEDEDDDDINELAIKYELNKHHDNYENDLSSLKNKREQLKNELAIMKHKYIYFANKKFADVENLSQIRDLYIMKLTINVVMNLTMNEFLEDDINMDVVKTLLKVASEERDIPYSLYEYKTALDILIEDAIKSSKYYSTSEYSRFLDLTYREKKYGAYDALYCIALYDKEFN